MRFLPDWAGDVIAGIVVAVGGYLLKMTRRVDVIETLQLEHAEDLKEAREKLDAQGEVVIRLDTLVKEFQNAIPEFRKMGELSSRLEGILNANNRRLELLEDTLLGTRTRHT